MRSAQAYDLIANADDVFASLKELEAERGFPRISDLKRQRRKTTGTMHVQHKHRDGTQDKLICHFQFAEAHKLIYIVGSTDARRTAFRTLKQMEKIGDQIDLHKITVDDLQGEIFDKIKADHPNIIKKMVADFGMRGIRYYNTIRLRKLSYELIDSQCASTHTAYDNFIKHAVDIRVTFGISYLLGIIEKSDGKFASMNATTHSSLSLYMQLDPLEWYKILEYLFAARQTRPSA